MKILKINSRKPNKNIIAQATKILKGGNLVIFPTETVYGLGANAFDKKAVRKIFKVKGRPENKPLIILIARKLDLNKVAKNIPRNVWLLAKKFWPGPLTLILKKKKVVLKEVTAQSETVAVRLSSHPVAKALVKELGIPITAPSANISGHPPHRTVKKILSEFKNMKEIKLILDAGKTPIGKPSTLIDLTKKPPHLLRQGSITKKQISRIIKVK